MTEKSLRRVHPGQPLDIPAGTWNRILDATEESESRGGIHSRGRKGHSPPVGVAIVYNRSAEDCPAHGVVEVARESPSATQAQVEIVQPGESAGSGTLYGIALEPVPSGKFGRAAFAGGPWPVRCDADPEAGEGLGAVDGRWYAEEGFDFTIARRRRGGLALVFFNRGVPRIYCPPHWKIFCEQGSGEDDPFLELACTGSAWVRTAFSWMAWKLERPLRVSRGMRLRVWVPLYACTAHYYTPSGEGEMHHTIFGYGNTRIILEDFDLDSLTYDALNSLDAERSNHLAILQCSPHPHCDLDQDTGTAHLTAPWHARDVYGFALVPPAGATITGTPAAGDYLQCRYPAIYCYHDGVDLYYPRARCWLLQDDPVYR